MDLQNVVFVTRDSSIQGQLTVSSTPWSWLQWFSRAGGRLIRVVALTGFTVCVFLCVSVVGVRLRGCTLHSHVHDEPYLVLRVACKTMRILGQ